MSHITTTPIKEGRKTIAYVVPIEDYNRYKELEELEIQENTELARIAKQSLKTGYASQSETDALFAEILQT